MYREQFGEYVYWCEGVKGQPYLFLQNAKEQSYSGIVWVSSTCIVKIVSPFDDHVLDTKSPLEILIQEFAQVIAFSIRFLKDNKRRQMKWLKHASISKLTLEFLSKLKFYESRNKRPFILYIPRLLVRRLHSITLVVVTIRGCSYRTIGKTNKQRQHTTTNMKTTRNGIFPSSICCNETKNNLLCPGFNKSSNFWCVTSNYKVFICTDLNI